MVAYIAQLGLLLVAMLAPADEQPAVSSDLQQYMLVLRRFEVPTEAAETLVSGSVSRRAAPTLRPFQPLPSGRDLNVFVEHVAVLAAEQPQYAVLHREVLGDWIVQVQDENERNGGAGVCLLAPKLVTSEGRAAEFSIEGEAAVQFQSRISGRADGTMQADVLLVRNTGSEGIERRRLQLEFSVVLSAEQPHIAVVVPCSKSASSARALSRILNVSSGKAGLRQSEVWTLTCERIRARAESASASSAFDRSDLRR